MRNMYIVIFIICLASIIVLAWYQSLRPHDGPTGSWVIYTLTPNGNHTQIQSTYSTGDTITEQIMWLKWDSSNRTAVYNYFRCTPSMPGCTVDGCPFAVLDDTPTVYRVKVVCGLGT